ncbi:Ferrous iron transport protein A [Planctomycetales bacterium 10988]|nr:Ferrous iron transport protein A [Planctomycetales bacterium 10988]
MKTLADCKVGTEGVVSQISGSDEISIRLLEMGLTPQTKLKLLGKAPLGDPLEIEVRGYRLSLRKSEATRVQLVS